MMPDWIIFFGRLMIVTGIACEAVKLTRIALDKWGR